MRTTTPSCALDQPMNIPGAGVFSGATRLRARQVHRRRRQMHSTSGSAPSAQAPPDTARLRRHVEVLAGEPRGRPRATRAMERAERYVHDQLATVGWLVERRPFDVRWQLGSTEAARTWQRAASAASPSLLLRDLGRQRPRPVLEPWGSRADAHGHRELPQSAPSPVDGRTEDPRLRPPDRCHRGDRPDRHVVARAAGSGQRRSTRSVAVSLRLLEQIRRRGVPVDLAELVAGGHQLVRVRQPLGQRQ